MSRTAAAAALAVALGAVTVDRNGSVGMLGSRSASADRRSASTGSINAVCDATTMFTRRAKTLSAVAAAMTAST